MMTLQLQTSNNCGISNVVSRSLTVTNGGGVNPTFFISPNPASSTITISQTSDTRSYTASETENKHIKSVRVTDKFGRNISIQRYGNETVEAELNISSLPVGIYFITINPGPDQETHSFIKK